MNSSQTLMITGGTGSFGKSMLGQVLAMPRETAPGKIIVFSRDEEKQFHQRMIFPDERVEYVVGDIRDYDRLLEVMCGVDVVIHAAALKQVPTGEYFPFEMVKTNVMGTNNLVKAANSCGVSKFIFLSTDKAVYPINAYGMSKSLAEKIIMAEAGKSEKNKSHTVFCAVRYGNVMGSRGSVIPLFLSQVKEGKALTITDGEMTRFLLKLKQATNLVNYAIEHGRPGRIYVKKSPGATVENTIKALELHFDCKCNREIIGIRPGEKMHETLLTADEISRSYEEIDDSDGVPITTVKSYFECRMIPDSVVVDKYEEKIPICNDDFTSADTLLLDPAGTLQLIKEAKLI